MLTAQCIFGPINLKDKTYYYPLKCSKWEQKEMR